MADEKTLKVNIDGSGAEKGAGVVSGAINSIKAVAQGLGNTLEQIQQLLAKSWSGSGPKTATESISQLNQESQAATASLNRTQSALTQSWSTTNVQAAASAVQSVGTAANNTTQQLTALAAVNNRLSGAITSLNAQFAAMRAQMSSIDDKAGDLRKILSILIPVELIMAGSKAFFEATNRLQGFLSTMTVVTGSVASSRIELANLFEIANRYGVSVTSLTESFAKLAASAKGTVLEGAQIRKVFESIVVASSAMHLSSEDTRLVLYALQQMVSKGTVSFEELRRQMAERFPGAMQIAADSMGMTNDAFQKLVKSGKLFTEDFLPGFAQGIMAAFSPALTVSTQSLLASVNRVSNAWEAFMQTLAESQMTVAATRAMESLATAIKNISPEAIRAIGSGIAEHLGQGARFIDSLDEKRVNEMMSAIGTGITALGQAFGVLLDLTISLAPRIEEIYKQITSFYAVLLNPDYSKLQGLGTIILTSLGIPPSVTKAILDYFHTVEEGAKTVEKQSVAQKEASNGFIGQYGIMASNSKAFFESEEKNWDQWGDAVSRKLASVNNAAKFYASGLAVFDDQVSRLAQQKAHSVQNSEEAAREAENHAKRLAGLLAENAAAELGVKISLKENDARARLATIDQTRKALALEIRSIQSENQMNEGGVQNTIELEGLLKKYSATTKEYVAAKKEANAQDKIAATAEGQHEDMLGRSIAVLKIATMEYSNLGKSIGNELVPAERELAKLEETKAFRKSPQKYQDAVTANYRETAAIEHQVVAMKEWLKTGEQVEKQVEGMVDKYGKETAALEEKGRQLFLGNKATQGAASAELEHFLSLEKVQLALSALTDKYGIKYVESLIAQARAAAAAKDEHQKYFDVAKQWADEMDRGTQAIEKETDKLNEQAETLALTQLEKDRLRVVTRENELAMIDSRIAIMDETGAYDDSLPKLVARRTALLANIDAMKNVTNAQATVDFQKNWIAAVDKVAERFSDFIKTGIQDGWGKAFKKLWSDFVVWGIEAVAKIALQEIAIKIFPQLASGFSQGANGPLGIFGNLFGGGSPQGGSIFGSGSNPFSGDNFFDSIGNFFNGSGGQGAGGTGFLGAGYGMGDRGLGTVGTFQSGGSGMFGIGSSGFSFGGMVSGAGIGAGVGAFSHSLYGNERNATGMNIGGTLGGMAGSYFGPIGSMVGAAIGSAIGSLFKDGGGPKTGGFYTTGVDLTSGDRIDGIGGERYFTPSDKDSTAKEIIDAVTATYTSVAKTLGMSSGTAAFALGFDVDPQGTANSRISVGANVGGQSVYSQTNIDAGRDQEGLEAQLKLESQRALLAALQASEMPEYLSKILDSVEISTASSEDIDNVIAMAQGLKMAVDVVGSLGDQFEKMDPDQIKALVESFGGLDTFIEAQQYLTDNFTTNSDQLVKSSDRLNETFEDLGREVPKDHKAFLALLGSLDLTTEEGRKAYASIMSVSDAFVEINGTAQEAADALNQAAQTGQEFFNENFLSDDEQSNNRIADDWSQVHKAWGDTAILLHALGYEHIPTTNEGFKEMIEAVKAKYGADSDTYKILIALAPAIFGLNEDLEALTDTASDAGDTIASSANQIAMAIQDLQDAASRAKTLYSSIVSTIDDVVGRMSGDFGAKMSAKISLINEQITKYTDLLASEMATNPYGPVADTYKGILRELAGLRVTASKDLALFVTLRQTYSAEISASLVDLTNSYKAQKEILKGNPEALAALEVIFKKEWDDIVNGTKSGVDDTIAELERLRKSIREWLDGLKVGDLSPLTPMQKLEESKNQFNAQLALAKGGNLDAMGNITKYAEEYLKLARGAYASSSTYTDIFNFVTSALATLSNYVPAAPSTTTTTAAAGAGGSATAPSATASGVSAASVVSSVQPILDELNILVDTFAEFPDYTAQFTSIENKLDQLIDLDLAQPDYTALLSRIADRLDQGIPPYQEEEPSTHQMFGAGGPPVSVPEEVEVAPQMSEDARQIVRRMDSMIEAIVAVVEEGHVDAKGVVTAIRATSREIVDGINSTKR